MSSHQGWLARGREKGRDHQLKQVASGLLPGPSPPATGAFGSGSASGIAGLCSTFWLLNWEGIQRESSEAARGAGGDAHIPPWLTPGRQEALPRQGLSVPAQRPQHPAQPQGQETPSPSPQGPMMGSEGFHLFPPQNPTLGPERSSGNVLLPAAHAPVSHPMGTPTQQLPALGINPRCINN